MEPNNFIITGVNPANNEKGVAVNSSITITFSTDMDQSTINTSNIRLSKINGPSVTVSISYSSVQRQATVTPTAVLEAGMQYGIHIVGGTTGIKTVTGSYLPESKTYEFTTTSANILSEPKNLAVSVTDGYPKATWTTPDFYDNSSELLYEAAISSSNEDPDAQPGAVIWPSEHDINKTSSNGINVPQRLVDGNYYFYVRALNGGNQSLWASSQFLVEANTTPETTEPTSPTTEPTAPIAEEPPLVESTGYFEVVETYPKENSADINPEKIILVMTDHVDAATVTPSSFYLVQKGSRGSLSYVDFLLEFSPLKAVPATTVVDGRVIYLTPDAPIENDKDYTVVVRESVANVNGETLGEPYSWSFLSEFTYLYGDADSIRNDVGGFIQNLTDRVLFKYMADVSRKAYDIASNVTTSSTTFNADDYADGKAPFHVHQYVRYQTEYDLLLNAHIQQSSGGSGAGTASSIRLGDLQVEGSSSSGGGEDAPDISIVLRSLRDRSKHWEDAIHGHHNRGYAKPVSVVKGETGSPYPEFLTRAEFSELGE